jgi:hypothetical protein
VVKRNFDPEVWKRKKEKMDAAYAESQALKEQRKREEREARRPNDPILEGLKHDQDKTLELPTSAPEGWYQKYKSRRDRVDFPSYFPGEEDWRFDQEEKARHRKCYQMLCSRNFFLEQIAVECLMSIPEVRAIAKRFRIHI